MKRYQSRATVIPGSSYSDVIDIARREQDKITKLNPRRQPYVRSKYFSSSKIFVAAFFTHTMQKSRKTRTNRLKFYNAAIDLLRHSRCDPETILKADLPRAILYRFYGVTKDRKNFCVQVKQDKRSGRKDFMSVWPEK